MSSANQNKTSTTGQKMESANNDKFRAELERLRLRPLWEMEVNERRTAPSEPSTHWQWNEILPLIEEAIRVAAVGAERRVLSLQNSATPNFSTALATLSGALQILLPGEHALPHRHSMNALRFVMEGSGATTRVDGKPCVMEEGDLILTPAWTWHEHVHTGTQRMVWFDCLDVPLHTYFNTTAFEPGPPASISPMRSDEELGTAGMLPAATVTTSGSRAEYSPLFRYAWSAACEAIDRMAPEADGVRSLHYVNPLNGGPVMAFIDCYLHELQTDRRTMERWSTASAMCVVGEGEGSSRIGDRTIEWRRNDIFTLPRKTWYSHRSRSRSAKLFLATDRDVLDRLGLLCEKSRN